MYYYPQFSSFFSLCSQQKKDYCWPRESTILGQSTLVIHVGATEDTWGRKFLAIQKKNCCWLKMKVREKCGEKERLWWITSGFDILFNYFGSCPIFLWVFWLGPAKTVDLKVPHLQRLHVFTEKLLVYFDNRLKYICIFQLYWNVIYSYPCVYAYLQE